MLENKIIDEEVLWKVYPKIIKISFLKPHLLETEGKTINKVIRILLFLLLPNLTICIVSGNGLWIKGKCCYRQTLAFFLFLFLHILHSQHICQKPALMAAYAGLEHICSPPDMIWLITLHECRSLFLLHFLARKFAGKYHLTFLK